MQIDPYRSDTWHLTLPGIVADLHFQAEDGIPFVSSRSLAPRFERKHDSVLRNIEDLILSPGTNADWFRPALSRDSYGDLQPAFDLRRHGFSRLVFGWFGKTELKVRYVQAFDAIEAILNGSSDASAVKAQLDLNRRLDRGITKVPKGRKRVTDAA